MTGGGAWRLGRGHTDIGRLHLDFQPRQRFKAREPCKVHLANAIVSKMYTNRTSIGITRDSNTNRDVIVEGSLAGIHQIIVGVEKQRHQLVMSETVHDEPHG